MTVFPSLTVFIGLTVVHCGSQTVKNWQTNTDYNNVKNWESGTIPCMTNNVVFPGDLNLPVALPETLTEVKSLILPRDGIVVFPPSKNADEGLTLTTKSVHASCRGGDVTFTRKGVAYWTDPKQWSDWTQSTPHLERIPCSTDIARFPDGSTFYVATPRKPPTVAFVDIQGQRVSGKLLTSIFTSKMGTEEFPMGELITATGVTCQDETGCECDNDYLTDEICARVESSIVPCDNPVKPNGFCHDICGAYLLFLNGSVPRVKKFLETFPGGEDVVSHVSKTSGFLQIVLTDKEGASGSLEQIASELHGALLESSLVSKLENMNSLCVSGLKYSRISLTRTFGDFILMALGAIIGFSLLICVYQHDRSFFKSLNFGHRVYDETISFARFENHGEAVDLIQEIEPVEENRVNNTSGIAFQNILYSENFQDVTLADLSHTLVPHLGGQTPTEGQAKGSLGSDDETQSSDEN